ncbi:MAG TPA: secretin N-terminal domain-containing protein [Verrucomicrobiota bacterium]|nr:secretin N-terminal domain-containing protein [Verrucomicrobiota bacterium]HNT14457.1 secretin N-terminal domain-containing protein [Verrucomicrobiota bacterium]
MKTKLSMTLLALATVTSPCLAEDPPAPSPAAGETPAPLAAPIPPETPAVAALADTNGPILLPNGEPGLRLNFRNASLDQVLNYLSEAAGFVIVLDTKITGKVDVWSNQPVSRDEAVELLNSVLNRNGYAAIRNDRILTIVNKEDAKTRDIPVVLGNDPDRIPKTDEMVTQILPVRYIEATQLLKDLQPLVSTSTTMSANEAGNAIIMTDTRANINRVAQIIKAVDTSAEDVTEVRVFHLEYADPTEMATLLSNLFPDDTRSGGNSQNQFQFGRGGFGRFFGGGGGNNANAGGDAQAQRVKKRARVIAVADQRTSSIIVSAASGLMAQVEEMIRQLDANPAKKQKVYVYQVNPGDVSQVQQILEDMFQDNTTVNRNRRNNQALQNTTLQNRATQNSTVNTTRSSSRTSNRGTGGGGF